MENNIIILKDYLMSKINNLFFFGYILDNNNFCITFKTNCNILDMMPFILNINFKITNIFYFDKYQYIYLNSIILDEIIIFDINCFGHSIKIKIVKNY